MTTLTFLTIVLFLLMVLLVVRYGIPLLKKKLPKEEAEMVGGLIREIKDIQMGRVK